MRGPWLQRAAFGVALTALAAAADAETGVTTTALNLRSCAGTGPACRILVTLQPDAELEILGSQDGWLRVRSASAGESGWVYGSFVRRIEEPEPAPAPTAEEPPSPPAPRRGPPPPQSEKLSLLLPLTPFLILLGVLLVATGIAVAALAWRGDRPPPDTSLLSKLTRATSYVGPTRKARGSTNFADIVMKGGITSGIVYPLAICEIAREYRLRNIGGTSAGAIAAALAAAAEYGRRNEHMAGDAKLAQLPLWLGGKGKGRRRGNMLGLFQPRPATRTLFELALLVMAPGAPLIAAVRGVRQALLGLGMAPWLGLVPGLLLAAFLALANLPASAVGLAAAAILWLLAAVAGLAILSLPVKATKARRALVLAAAALAILIIVAGPFALARWVAPSLSIVGHTWSQEGALLLAVLGLLAGCVVALVRTLLVAVPEDRFGICSGMPEGRGDRPPALVPWLHEQIQEMAGRELTDAPLTFRDLEVVEEKEEEAKEPAEPRQPEPPWYPIRLRMMTTCVTFGGPYLLPFETKIFYFDPREMEKLFPPEVVGFMVEEANRWSQSAAPEGFDQKLDPYTFPEPADHLVNRYLYPKLPLPLDRLPLVVAARMSMSFPLLLSAVPLWAIDWRDADNKEARTAWAEWVRKNGDYWEEMKTRPGEPLKHQPPDQRPRAECCWFSDGGICSNFPVHLFDELLPRWPTFGINLKYGPEARRRPSRVQLARTHGSGLLPHWTHLTGEDGAGPGSLPRFLGAVFGAMQNWADNSMLRVPGYRDRVVHLHLSTEEGGLNLDMEPEQIGQLARWGREAGEALARRFKRRHASGSELSWDNHRWTRLRSSLAFLQEEIEELVSSYQESAKLGGSKKYKWRSYEELVNRTGDDHPTSYKFYPARAQRELAQQTFEKLEELVALWQAKPPGFCDTERPKPPPKLHIRAPLQK